MRSVRIGKDVVIKVTNLKIDGAAYSPQNYTATIAISNSIGTSYLLPTTFDTATSTIIGKLSGVAQLNEGIPLGEYTISVWINYGKEGQTVIDWTDKLAFVDVSGDEASGSDDIVTVSVSGNILSGLQSLTPATESENGLMSSTDKKKLNSVNGKQCFDSVVVGTKSFSASKDSETNPIQFESYGGIGISLHKVDGVTTISIYGEECDGDGIGMMSGSDKVKLNSLAPVYVPQLMVKNEVLYLLAPKNFFKTTDVVEVARYGNHNHTVTYHPKDENGNLLYDNDGNPVKQRFRRRKKGWIRVGTEDLGINMKLSAAVQKPYRPSGGTSSMRYINYIVSEEGESLKTVVLDLVENHNFTNLLGSKMGIRITRDGWPITEWMPITVVKTNNETYAYSRWRCGIKV